MTLPATSLDAALEATWPPSRRWRAGPFVLRDGAGGGKRVSAATLEEEEADRADIARAERAMQDTGGPVLFRIRTADDALDSQLAACGYRIVDPTLYYTTPPRELLNPDQRPLDAVASETLLGIQAEIWADGGIGAGRLDVMYRVRGPRAFLLARLDNRAAGTGFVALHDGLAMVHALEVRPAMRRRGAGRAMLHRAAKWAAERGAERIALAVTEGNTAANRLYATLGMKPAGRYHYREQALGHDP